MKPESDCLKWMEKQQIKTADKTIPSLVVVSLIYLILCLIFLAFSEPCSSVGIPLINTHLTCLAPNEVGDLLAGLFAPLAFLGLFWAVLIQSKELKAQREELSLTREELRLTREEMKLARETQIEQVYEMKASTQFISAQTKILTAQERRQVISDYDKEFDSLIDNLSKKMSTCSSMSLWGNENNNPIGYFAVFYAESNFYQHCINIVSGGNGIEKLLKVAVAKGIPVSEL